MMGTKGTSGYIPCTHCTLKNHLELYGDSIHKGTKIHKLVTLTRKIKKCKFHLKIAKVKNSM